MRAEFPSRLRGEEVAGIDLVLLDADVAGCVVNWGAGGAAQQAERDRRLRLLIEDVDVVLQTLSARREVEYYRRLRTMASLVVQSPA